MTVYLNRIPKQWPPILGVDIEATSLDPFLGKLLSIALSDGKDAWIFLHIHDFKQLIPVLTDENILKIFHNAAFDLMWLQQHLGVRVQNVYDTLVTEQTLFLGKNLPNTLKEIVARRCGRLLEKETVTEFIDHPGFDRQPLTTTQLNYMVNDTLYLLAIREQQLVDMSATQAGGVVSVEQRVVPIIADMKLNGLQLDVALWDSYQTEIQKKIEDLQESLINQLGEDYKLPVERKKNKLPVIEEIPTRQIKWNSPQQMLALLNTAFNTAPKRARKLTENELLWLRYDHIPIPEGDVVTDEILEYFAGDPPSESGVDTRQLSSADEANVKNTQELSLGISYDEEKARRHKKFIFTSTSEPALQEYLDIGTDERVVTFIQTLLDFRSWKKMQGWNYPSYLNPVTGKVHPDWHQLGPGTGRMSCSNPNLQNVPTPHENEPNLRRLWIPDSIDYVILGCDYSQQEMRVVADLCQDPAMLRACNEMDVYLEFAKLMFGHEVDKKSEERYIAKQFVLAVGYGAGNDKLHATSKLPYDECDRIRNVIRQTFPRMVQWGQQQHSRLMQYGYCTTRLGRRRYFENKGDRKYTTAVNTPVQGTAADMLKLAMVYVNDLLTREQIDGRIWLVVHDEIDVQVRRDQAEQALPLILKEMERAGSELCPSVKHYAEGGIFNTWDK